MKAVRIAIIFLVGLASAIASYHTAEVRPDAPPTITPARLKTAPIPAQTFRAARPVFPFSVVAGSLKKKKELEETLAKDAAVAKHFSGVNPDRLFPRPLKRDMDLFASFRLGNNFYWTKHPIHLKAGEVVLTDGVNMIRARCGNRLALLPPLPPAPPSPVDPPEIVFDAGTPGLETPSQQPPILAEIPNGEPVLPEPVPSPGTLTSTPPTAPPGGPGVLPPVHPCCSTHSEQPPVSPPITPVPEPSSLVLFVSGLAAAAGYSIRRLRGK
ncbi:MAG: PEP-CTERM sorting domain-containing protein [Acidobacteriaceae bacterium]|nr:PEP-CTERM sorting domain-containing protein [Acidobacteriaceae bacterium]